MKNIYSILSLFLLLISISVLGQTKIYAPNLSAPENMETNQMPDVILDWEAVTGITLDITYELQLANNYEFTDAYTFPRTSVTATSMSNLIFGANYFWRVRAYDSEDASGWSDAWSFSVVGNVSDLDPNDGDEEYSNPVITWDQLSGVSGYILQLDTVYGWSVAESPVTSDCNATYIIDESNIWVAGNDGVLLHSDSANWVNIESGTTEDLNDLFFIDESSGYAVGDAGVVLFYNGSAWTPVEVGTTEDLLAVSFADASNGVAVGTNGIVVIYTNGTWEIEATGDGNTLYDVDMVNPSNIWACGVEKIVVNYNGVDWTASELGTKDHYGIDMIDENNGWIVGKGGKVFGWNGDLWFEIVSGVSKNLNSVSFVDGKGIAVGASGTMLIFNGAWSVPTKLTGDDLEGVMLYGDIGLAVGESGTFVQKLGDGFDSPALVTFDIHSDSANWPLNNLLFGQDYYYRIVAYHGADTSFWSGAQLFVTVASPELDSPSNSSSTDLLVKFGWDEYEGITNYIFQIDNNDSFSQPRSFSPDDDTLWVNDLVFGQEYFWRVAAQHALDISGWSEVWSFNTINMITLESPADGAIEIILCPAYSWEEVYGASGYELWVDTDASFANPGVANVDEPTFQCQSQLEKNTMYFWKVRGKAGPDVSDWSDTWSFTTEGSIGIDEKFDINEVVIFPNPSNGNFVLDIVSDFDGKYDVSVIDISGKLIYISKFNFTVGNNSIPVSINNINSGAYSLMISNGSNKVIKRLLIN